MAKFCGRPLWMAPKPGSPKKDEAGDYLGVIMRHVGGGFLFFTTLFTVAVPFSSNGISCIKGGFSKRDFHTLK